jgi:hypothetical protein
MNYFWIVIVMGMLLYIVYRVYQKSNNYGALRNAFLAKYTYDRLTKDERTNGGVDNTQWWRNTDIRSL